MEGHMSQLPNYSTLFTTLYDEPAPIGNLGRGTHYSIMRSVEWQDVVLQQLDKPQIHDFAVIWDEDHDTRVFEAIEKIYMAGHLSPVQFIGERKGFLTVIVAARFYFYDSEQILSNYKQQINEISQSLDDTWPSDIGSFDRAYGSEHQCINEGIIADNEYRVLTYIKNIDSLWGLGIKEYHVPNHNIHSPAIPVF